MKDKMTLEEFVEAVDRNVEMRFGISVFDLPDVDFHGFWVDGEGDIERLIRDAADDAIARA